MVFPNGLLQIHLSMLQLTAALHLQGESEFPEGVLYFLKVFCIGIPNSLGYFAWGCQISCDTGTKYMQGGQILCRVIIPGKQLNGQTTHFYIQKSTQLLEYAFLMMSL